MRKPTVALIAPTLEILGGHATQAQELMRGLQSDGHRVLFIPINPSVHPGLRWLRQWRYMRTIVNEACYLLSLIRLKHADIVHVFSASYWSFVLAPLPAILVARGFGKRVVLDYHSGEAPDHLARWGMLVHPWLRLADEIVVASEYLQTVFGHHGYATTVIPNLVETSRFIYRDRRILRPRLLSTRNLEPYYRLDNTLQAFARVRARYADATLTIVGYGSKEDQLRRLAAALGVKGIRFMGRVEPDAMPGVYGEADIFLNSSVVDNQPKSVLEAFAAGLSVVSTGAGDLAALVRNGETGLIVPPQDPGAMADAIMALLEDPEGAAVMARRARREVERHTWPYVRYEWAAVYSGNGSAREEPEQTSPPRRVPPKTPSPSQ